MVSWGGRHGFGRGGNSLTVQRQLVDVQRLSATDGAFAALLGDGRVPWEVDDSGCFFFLKASNQKPGKKHTTKTGENGGVGEVLRRFVCFFLWDELTKDSELKDLSWVPGSEGEICSSLASLKVWLA